MSSLLARFAGNIFWLARYLERAENLARILDINETYARDDREGPDWKRVLDLYVDRERFLAEHDETDAKSVLTYYILDRNNPTSILSSMRSARENARSVRHLISTEMWTHLNVSYNRVKELKQPEIRPLNLSRTVRKIIAECQTFEGIAEGTFFRGEPWCFYQLGKYAERADQTTRILDMGYDRLNVEQSDAVAWVHWSVLLRSVSGYHAFCSCHPAASNPYAIVAFLLYDTEFPRAVALCVDRITDRLRELEERHGGRRSSDLERARRSLEFSLTTGLGRKFQPKQLHGYLDQIQGSLAQVGAAIAEVYFH